MNKEKSKILWFLLLFPVFCFFVVYIFWVYSCGPVTTYEDEHKERIVIPAGMTVREAASLLKKQKLIHNETVFYLAAKYPWLDKSSMSGLQTGKFKMKSGVYEIGSSMALSEIFELLSTGTEGDIKLSLPEGLTLHKIAQRLKAAGICTTDSFMEAAGSDALLAEYHIPAQSFEGYLFPDTYFFLLSMTGEQVIRTMADNFFKQIKDIPELSGISPKQLYDTVILASIVEREYRVDTEAPLIASVFKNRLTKHIGLYSCATVEYIITEIENKPHPDIITYDDLQLNSQYNTYKWAGLPPGPISNPGMVALRAAANPPKTNYFFFRLTDPAAGTHSFSTDFKTHINEGHRLYTKTAAGK